LGFLKKTLGDLCISRPKNRLSWGIELPFDKDFVCYVWFDALVNYISTVGYRRDDEKFAKWWPASYHLIGKDILTTHTVYWPTMLKAMNLPMPETIFAHGWWLIGESKMSKSAGNVVNPMEMIEKYGVDAFRFFLISEMSLGQDASFTEEAFISRYNSNLANDLGNLTSRVIKMIFKQCNGVLPEPDESSELECKLKNSAFKAVNAMENAILNMKLDRGIEEVMNAIRAGNRYMEQTAPWKLAKEGNIKKLNTVLYTTAELLRVVSGLLMPVMPEKMRNLRRGLGITETSLDIENLKKWDILKSKVQCEDNGPLFPRVEVKKIEKPVKKNDNKNKKEQKEENAGLITIDEFFKAKLKTAEIISAEKIEKADKLLRLQIKIGNEKRQIVAGIAQDYSPDSLIGKKIIVVANLKPAVIRGIESQGMLLAVKNGNRLTIVTVQDDIPSGLSVG
jgi:methionyl-tRNA synthetase